MFSSKETKRVAEEVATTNNIVGKGTCIEGNLETTANIRIEGKIIGNIKSKAKLVLGETAHIEGNILSQNAEIAGEVFGTVEVSDLLILKSSAVINGDIISNKLSVEPGATFNGGCKMGAVIKDIVINESPGKHTSKTA